MTLITLYYRKPQFQNDTEGIICLADSLISNISNLQSSITEQSIKILNCRFNYATNFKECPKLIHNEFGLTFAGNVSIAMQTYNIARICFSHLLPTTQKNFSCPSLKSAAILVSQILEHYYKCYGFSFPNNVEIEFAIFGFCFAELKFKLYHIKPHIINNEVKTCINDIDITNTNFFCFGSGKQEFLNYYEKNSSKTVLNCFRQFLKTDKSKAKGVGGYMQKCFVNKGYFRYFADFQLDDNGLSNIHNAQFGGFSFNNCFLDDYMVSFVMNPFLE